MSGAQIVIESLKRENVDIIFGYPGGAVLSLYDALYIDEFPHVLTRHEQGAIHAADGYARATGKVGVCIATSGPGATNLITGIATAYMDSIPLVVITGQVAVSLIGRDSFQEADTRGISTPITKHNYLVKDAKELAKVMKEAFYIARTGRPGPVLVDIAKNVFIEELDFEYPETVSLRGYKPVYSGDSSIIDQVVCELAKAEKPLFFVGGGLNLSGAAEQARELVDYLGFPVISSLMGLGGIPNDHPNFYGMVGMHGTYPANMATTETDLLVGFGVRFDDRVTGLLQEFAPKAKIIHFDVDPAEINKNVPTQIKVVGDLNWSLKTLYQKVKETDSAIWKSKVSPWLNLLHTWKEEKPLTYELFPEQIAPQTIIERISDFTNGEAVIVTDVGQHQMWAAQFYNYKNPRTLLTSGGLGTMGYGLPAALGAQVGIEDKPVVLFTGDGGFMMNCQELSTIADLNLPVKIFILNNQMLGMVAQWQRMFFKGHYAHSKMGGQADFVKMGEAMGVPGYRISKPDELDAALTKALNTEGPVLVEIRIPEEADVLPMVPAGARLDQMIMGGK